ncbi:methyltransferase domain-containing protein [Myxococcota bacterium]|nr:methyltransferase domain-containing protein [Myxococcota bacterium]MBU1431347.1 methyltransferase domain-containing protein [Myxococcota bacterium]MBU1900283.1 methyltransferase domain-containing protein [Myxococcota bacterium]
MKDNRAYYDDFAGWYENERHHGYHAFLDTMQLEIAAPLAAGRDALEVGCGTGLILRGLAREARHAIGVDISGGMLKQARARGLNVVQGSATELPFADASFDAVVSFKVLAHVEDIRAALSEVGRVLRPGGFAALEFYNRHALRYLIKRLKPAHRISEQTTDEEVYTRYDSLKDVRGYLPPSLKLHGVRGVRVLTPFAAAHKLKLISRPLTAAERLARDLPPTARLGGFLIVILERVCCEVDA